MSSLFIARKNSEKNGPSTTYPAVLVLLFLDYVVKTRTSSSTSCTLNAKDKETGKLSPSPRTPAIHPIRFALVLMMNHGTITLECAIIFYFKEMPKGPFIS